MADLDDLVAVVARLRGDGGCPWDRSQTLHSLRPYLLEEAHEALGAVDVEDDEETAKELGDLLFVTLLMIRIAEEEGRFSLSDVTARVVRKMIHRHPHVFDPSHARRDDDGSLEAWEARKAHERGDRSALDGVPDTLPALLRAHRIGEKASRVGFDWPDVSGVRAKLDEEVAELDEALASGDPAKVAHEYGDVLLTLANLGRFLPVGGEEALRTATARFEGRFRHVEGQLTASGRAMEATDAETLEAFWQRAKREVTP